MDFSTARSERVTAIVSTLVAVVILAAGVTAHQSRNIPVDDIVQLESDLRFQLEVGFRHDASERVARLTQLEEVFAAWQQSPRSSTDRELLTSWLLEATIRSMPGSIESLPAIPQFGQQQPVPTAEPTADVLVTPPESAKFAELPKLVPTLAESVSTATYKPATLVNVSVASEAPHREWLDEQSAVDKFFAVEKETAEPVRINLTELAARIAGYHEGLDEVETALLTLDANDFPALSSQIHQLDEMTRDLQFVRLYYDALTDQERRSIAEPRSMRATLTEIERRLDRNQQALEGDFLGEFDASHQEQIAQLHQQLADVASRTDW